MLENVKALLGFSGTDNDDKLKVIISVVCSRLCALLGTKEVPKELEYIATEVSIVRFNRIGSEGMQSHQVEGESISYLTDDFAAFADDIARWKADQEKRDVGVIRFL